MKEYGSLLPEEKWQAVIQCDSRYDGIFFYGVRTTGIFCRPSCKSKAPVPGNIIFFEHPAEARQLGFRPCKRCCPERTVFQPELELVKKVQKIIDDGYQNRVDVQHISRQLGVSKNHLIKLFKRYCGVTPAQYITSRRVAKAIELLRQGEAGILEVAYAAGFRSLSTFYKCFKERTGYAPGEVRENTEIPAACVTADSCQTVRQTP